MANNVPLTIQTAQSVNVSSEIVIGSNRVSCDYTKQNLYWIVVVDRADLSIQANFTFSGNSAVPSQLTPYLKNTQYVLILTTQNLNTANLPQGDFYNYLVGEGAGAQLNRAEQIFEALSCGTFGSLNYAFVVTMGDDTTSGYEFLDIYNPVLVSTLYFFPTTVEGKTLYTPAV